MHKLLLSLLLVSTAASAQQALTAVEIMARVATNQDAADAARSHFIYTQHARVQSRKGKTTRCEETTDYRITPTKDGSAQTLLKLEGRVLYKGQYLPYTTLDGPKGVPAAEDTTDPKKIDDDTSTDRDLVENTRKNMLSAKSRDGISAHLFPLTSKNQADMLFTLLGREPKNGRSTFHITFRPKDNDDFGWKGDAWIDTEAFQPVVIRTEMSRKIPFAVRGLLGTDVPGLGFTATYAPQPSASDPAAVWFPESFGTEFRIKLLFFFHRQIILSASNRNFERTHTSSTIRAIGDPDTPATPPSEP